MKFLDMFDKIDDIVYKPIETVCNWAQEPLRYWEYNRDMNKSKNDTELRVYEKGKDAELSMKMSQFDVELQNMIEDHQDARRDHLVEAIKKYKLDLAEATKNIVNDIGSLSIELRKKAADMVSEKTKEYEERQNKVKRDSLLELKEAKEMFFEEDLDTYNMLRENILEERKTMFDLAADFIKGLSDDIKKLNATLDDITKDSLKVANNYLNPIQNEILNNPVDGSAKAIEDGRIIYINEE